MDRPKIYLDSCYWIRGTHENEPDPTVTAALQHQLTLADKGEIIIVASSLILIESLTVDPNHFDKAFDGRRGILVAVSGNLAKKVRAFQNQVRARTTKMFSAADAIHLVTAQEAECNVFYTLDQKEKKGQLAPLSSTEMIKELLGLSVEKLPPPPNEAGQGTLGL